MTDKNNLIRWHGIIAILNTFTTDGRPGIIADQFTWRQLTLPVRDGRITFPENIGTIENIYISGNEVHGSGYVDKRSTAGRELESRETLPVADDFLGTPDGRYQLIGITIVNNPAWQQCQIRRVI